MMEDKIRISVIIPVYNAADCLPRAVASVCMQDVDSYEVILVDDGSTDGSGRICDELAAEYGAVRVIHQRNGGVSVARNAGIDAAVGEYIMFLDADDVVCEDSFTKLSSLDADMVMGGFEKLGLDSSVRRFCPAEDARYEGTERISTFLDRIIARDNTYLLNSACFKLYRRELIERYSIRFAEGLSYAEDKIFVMSFLQHVGSVCTIASVIYGYIVKPGSLSSDMSSDRHILQVLRLLKEYKPVLDSLRTVYPASLRLERLYHVDFIGRYVCRILTIFCKRRTDLLNKDTLRRLYGYMSEDEDIGVFSVRPGQVLNILLFKIGSPSFSIKAYRAISSVYSFLKK